MEIRPCLRVRSGWEAAAALVQANRRIRLNELEEDGSMKNTGKRIFYSVVFFALMGMPVAFAYAIASTR
jgi:hypothetical protein